MDKRYYVRLLANGQLFTWLNEHFSRTVAIEMDVDCKIKPDLKIQCDVNKMIIILIYRTEIEICQRI